MAKVLFESVRRVVTPRWMPTVIALVVFGTLAVGANACVDAGGHDRALLAAG
jgi:hypothetical protein